MLLIITHHNEHCGDRHISMSSYSKITESSSSASENGAATNLDSVLAETRRLGLEIVNPTCDRLSLENMRVLYDLKQGLVAPILGYACAEQHTDLIRLLLDAKADLNKQGSDGMTPLSQAVAQCDTAMVQYLLDAKADPFVKIHSGSTPVDMARTIGCSPIINMFANHSREFETANRKYVVVFPFQIAACDAKIPTMHMTLAFLGKQDASSLKQMEDDVRKSILPLMPIQLVMDDEAKFGPKSDVPVRKCHIVAPIGATAVVTAFYRKWNLKTPDAVMDDTSGPALHVTTWTESESNALHKGMNVQLLSVAWKAVGVPELHVIS
jgi:hypothetical protein